MSGKPAPDFERYWRKNFESFAQACEDEAGIAGWQTTGLATRLRHFRRVWRPGTPGQRWLDAGCGAGSYTRVMAEAGLRLTGMDYSQPTAAKAKQRDTLGLDWAVADVTALPVQPGSFDGVVCLGVTQALSSSEKAVHELVAAARPGGVVWVDALNYWCLPNFYQVWRRRVRKMRVHLRYERPGALRRLLREAGCDRIELHWLPVLPERFQRHQWIFETPVVVWLLHSLPPLGALLSHSFVLCGRRAAS